jgi:hypothetical protein
VYPAAEPVSDAAKWWRMISVIIQLQCISNSCNKETIAWGHTYVTWTVWTNPAHPICVHQSFTYCSPIRWLMMTNGRQVFLSLSSCHINQLHINGMHNIGKVFCKLLHCDTYNSATIYRFLTNMFCHGLSYIHIHAHTRTHAPYVVM